MYKKKKILNFLFNNLIIFKYFTEICSYDHGKTKPNRFLNFNHSLNFAAYKILTHLKLCRPRPGSQGPKHKSMEQRRALPSQIPTSQPQMNHYLYRQRGLSPPPASRLVAEPHEFRRRGGPRGRAGGWSLAHPNS